MLLKEKVSSGTGIYTIPEAATYARMSPTTLSRWLKGNHSGSRVFELPDRDARIIDFLEFIQALAVRNLRLHYGISLQKIRDAVKRASDKYRVDHPFARRHTTYLFDGQIWIRPQMEGSSIVQLSGREHGQESMIPVVERFMLDISFHRETGRACRYKAYEKGNHQIIMDPQLRFGEPMLPTSGYTPRALFEAAKSEGSAEQAARIYGVSKEEVELCIDYFDHLQAA